MWELNLSTIFGAAVGFEFCPREMFEKQGVEDVNYGFFIDLLFIRISFVNYKV